MNLKIDVFFTSDPKSDPRFGLPDPDYLRSNYVLTINGQQLVVAKTDVLLTLTHTLTDSHKLIFFHKTLPTVEGMKANKSPLLIILMTNGIFAYVIHIYPWLNYAIQLNRTSYLWN
jgi:hypothetical protein